MLLNLFYKSTGVIYILTSIFSLIFGNIETQLNTFEKILTIIKLIAGLLALTYGNKLWKRFENVFLIYSILILVNQLYLFFIGADSVIRIPDLDLSLNIGSIIFLAFIYYYFIVIPLIALRILMMKLYENVKKR